jgi:hypothetical protein
VETEATAARVGLWSFFVAVVIDSVGHPHYWGWWTSSYGSHASGWERALVMIGAVAALFDLHDMLTLETVAVPDGYRRTLWFPRKEFRVALRSGLAINREDESQLVSRETYMKLLRNESTV